MCPEPRTPEGVSKTVCRPTAKPARDCGAFADGAPQGASKAADCRWPVSVIPAVSGPAERGVDGSRARCRRPGVCRVAGCARWTAERYVHCREARGADDVAAVVFTGAEERRGWNRTGRLTVGLLVRMMTRATCPVAAKPPVQARDGRTPDGANPYGKGKSWVETIDN